MACRASRQKRELVRVVRSPEGVVAIDPTGRAPGRGAYVCADPACQGTAMARGALRKALEVPIPAALFEPALTTASGDPAAATAAARAGATTSTTTDTATEGGA